MAITDTISSIRTTLEFMGSSLSDFKTYSNLWAIFRSVAGVVDQQEAKLKEVQDNFYLSTATGEALDRRALDLGLTRSLGTKAQGYVLAQSSTSLTLRKGAIVSLGDLQYEFTDNYTVTNLEIAIPIRAINSGSRSNLESGTLLSNVLYPQLRCEVGRYRDANGKAIGSLSSGSDPESDNDLRTRLRDLFGQSAIRQLQALVTNATPEIGRIHLVEHYPMTGYLTAYVASQDGEVLDQVSQVLNTYKAEGVITFVQPIQIQIVDVRLDIQLSSITGDIEDRITKAVDNFFTELNVGQTLEPNLLNSFILIVPEVVSSKVVYPTELEVPSDVLLNLGKLQINLSLSVK